MRVLVCVHVRDGDACRLNPSNLRRRFSKDLGIGEAPGNRSRRKPFQAIAESTRFGQRRDSSRIENRLAIDQDHMASNA